MAEAKIPYVMAYGNITKVLEKIQPAATPDRFTQDFLATKLGMSGGGARPLIPYLKRTGFLASDGVPTDRYRKFRAAGTRGAAAASGLRQGYSVLYELNEYAHALDDKKLKELIILATGFDSGSSTVPAIVASFRALQAFADFDAHEADHGLNDPTDPDDNSKGDTGDSLPLPSDLHIGYTINLHLPPTSDVAVFNAIFKALRENLLR